MTKQTSKIMALVAIAGLVAGLTGCRHMPVCHSSPVCVAVCQENLKDGLATILCQPMDVEATNGQTEAKFEVSAVSSSRTSKLYYQWYFKDVPVSDNAYEKRNSNYGRESELIVKLPENPSEELGFYHCEIDSTDVNGMPRRTSTRMAALGRAGLLPTPMNSSITTPTQPLPRPGSPKPSSCAGYSYCSWVNFYNGGAGYLVYGGNNFITVNSSSGATPVPAAKYFVVVYDIKNPAKPTSFCVTGNTGTRMSFTGVAGDPYLFTVCFIDSTYNNQPLISMRIDPN